MSMAVRDLREFVALLEQHEEIQRVQEEVDWNLEMGAIIRRCYDIGGPAVLFENVRDYPKGFRALGASLGPSRRPGHSLYARMAMALGLAPDTPLRGIMDHYLERKEKPIKPTLVKNGPCKENILSGKDVDLLKFPFPPYLYEAYVAGRLPGEPIPLVKCETIDLEVPATAEIVLEGEVLPHERKTEGPLGESMAYEAGKSSPNPVFRVHAIPYRDAP